MSKKRLTRMGRFVMHFARHAAKGMPKATRQQIENRLAICNACEHFKDDRCELCGCRCGNRKQFLNKLAWSDQTCPDGRWEAVERQADSG